MAPIALDTLVAALPEPIKQSKPVSVLLHATTAQPLVTSASGLHFTLSNGGTVLDAASGGAAVICLGNGDEEVISAMAAQSRKISYSYHQTISSDPSEELGRYLTDKSEGWFAGAAFLSSGSEAIEAAIKMARQYWVEAGEPQREFFIGRAPSYHGNTLGALAVSHPSYLPPSEVCLLWKLYSCFPRQLGHVKGRRDIYEPILSQNFKHVSSPTYLRSHFPSETEEAYSQRLAAELEAKILELGPKNVIAFAAEPVVGAALGVMPPPRGYFPAIHAVLKKYNILLIMDEVMSGTGRVGELFAHQADGVGEGVRPDILTMAKGLGSGYVSISGVLVNHRVKDMLSKNGQVKNSHTYQGHPVACATALKVQQIVEREDLLANVRERGEQLLLELRTALQGIDQVFDVRGKGLFVGVDIEAPTTLKPRLASRIKERAFDNGLMVLGLSGTVDGDKGEAVVLAPGYIVTKEQITEMVTILARSIKECLAEL
ncbi:hypothetical protein P7C73_g3335, partial [Tremellales sp. Uapishka_1]